MDCGPMVAQPHKPSTAAISSAASASDRDNEFVEDHDCPGADTRLIVMPARKKIFSIGVSQLKAYFTLLQKNI
jgi:hypothetical protein